MEPSKGMKMAKQMMEKLGWKEGNGLGLKQDGITEALKPSAKFDVSGLGHKNYNDFQWWDHAFNRAAKAFDVKITEDEVAVVEKKGKNTGRIKTRKDVIVDPDSLAYAGNFCKTGTLNNGVVENTTSVVCIKEEKDYSLKLSDEELFKMCNGLTAHKGARHGLTASGKLARIAQQEAMMLASLSEGSLLLQNVPQESTEKKKKNKKCRITEHDSETQETDEAIKPKKKKKPKSADIEISEERITASHENECVKSDKRKKKKKKDREVVENENQSSVVEEQDERESCPEPKKKKKKTKQDKSEDS